MSASVTLTKIFEIRNVKECSDRILKYLSKSKVEVNSNILLFEGILKSECKGKCKMNLYRNFLNQN